MTVAPNRWTPENGGTAAPASSVTVNGQAAQIYGDFTFAGTNLALANGQNTIITNVAVNLHGLTVTNLLSVNLPSSVALLYDNNGNLTNDGARSFGCDAENQLTNVYVPGQWRSDFVYDGLNRRRIERDFIWSGSTWTKTSEIHFIYDGYLLIQERDANNNVLVTYTRGLDMSGSLSGAGGIGGLLARTETKGSTFYHADGGGNITALIDGSENIVARYAYGPFGRLIAQWGPMAPVNEMRFSSMPFYSSPQIYGYLGRFYDPNLQRWPNQDPIGERGGVNLYGFVGNSPVNYVDPYGLILEGFGDWELSLWDKMFVGGPGAGPDPNSQGALSANAGYGFHPLYDEDGNPLGNPASAVGGAVVGGVADAASLLTGGGEAKGAIKCEKAAANWLWPKGKGVAKMLRQVEQRGWTPQQITEAIEKGQQFAAKNLVNPGNPAIRYVNPTTGQSVVIDTVTHEVLHVGGPGFKY
jgi:RHS repeat-associated protein